MKWKFAEREEEQVKEAGNREEVQVRRKINFETELEPGSDSDTEVFFDKQAHKRRRMAKDIEELKVWMEKKFDASSAAAAEQNKAITNCIAMNTERSIKNADDIAQIRGTITE